MATQQIPLQQVYSGKYKYVITWQIITAVLWFIGIILAVIFAYPFSPGYEAKTLQSTDVVQMIIGTIFLLLVSSLAVLAGIGMYKKTSWGRVLAIVSSCFSFLLVPFGIVFGTIALVFLVKRI